MTVLYVKHSRDHAHATGRYTYVHVHSCACRQAGYTGRWQWYWQNIQTVTLCRSVQWPTLHLDVKEVPSLHHSLPGLHAEPSVLLPFVLSLFWSSSTVSTTEHCIGCILYSQTFKHFFQVEEKKGLSFVHICLIKNSCNKSCILYQWFSTPFFFIYKDIFLWKCYLYQTFCFLTFVCSKRASLAINLKIG